MIQVNTEELQRTGFTLLRGAVHSSELAEFEDMVQRFAFEQAQKLSLAPTGVEPFIDVFSVGGSYTDRIYQLMERLFILHKITVRVGNELASSGFLKWARIDVPLIWPDIRADIPNDSVRVLPVHQDFGSTQSERAWRLWIALRPTSEILGSMVVYPGTHKSGAWPHNLDNPLMPYVEEKYYAGVEGVTFEIEAGDAVLMNPLVLHASVPNRSKRTKFTLMIQIQDYLSVIHPEDNGTQLASLQTIAKVRAKARAEQTR